MNYPSRQRVLASTAAAGMLGAVLSVLFTDPPSRGSKGIDIMTHHDPSPAEPKGDASRQPLLKTPAGLAICAFLAIAGVLLVFEHRVHLLGAWPLLFLLVCGGMHFFMHRGHGGHGGHGGGSDER